MKRPYLGLCSAASGSRANRCWPHFRISFGPPFRIRKRAAQLREVYPEGTSFQLWELPACQLLLQRKITDEQYREFIDKSVPLLVPASSPTTPGLLEPQEGATFDLYPRRTVVSWNSVPTAATYVLEVQVIIVRMGRRSDGSLFPDSEYWGPHNDGLHHANVAGTSAVFYFIGAQRGRVRVRAVATNGGASAPTRWRNFRYKR